MNTPQPGILEPVPRIARHLFFRSIDIEQSSQPVKKLLQYADGKNCVVGFDLLVALSLHAHIDGLRKFPDLSTKDIDIPVHQHEIWCWLRGNDRGDLVHQTKTVERLIQDGFILSEVIDAFQHRDSRDLTGYEDGTENPEGEEAITAAILQSNDSWINGSSFAAFQLWEHDLDKVYGYQESEMDLMIGRHKHDNEEIDDAPSSAHVKRTAQESFQPEAFILRRSMPWADAFKQGLAFLAFGKSFDAFEMQLRRMIGLEDGIVDALFNFTKPVTGGYYWCPPMRNGKIHSDAFRALKSG